MKLVNDEYLEFEELSLEELHKKAHENKDTYDNYNNGEYETTDTNTNTDFEYDITPDIQNPYDYGSQEYLDAMTRIKANRDKYRQNKEKNKVLKHLIKNNKSR